MCGHCNRPGAEGALQSLAVSTATTTPIAAPTKAMDRIRKALLGGHPLLYVLTWEESRVERLAQHLAKTFYGAPASYGVWSVVDGLVVDGNPVPGTQDPLKALETILAASGKGFYLMKDFPTAGDGRPEIIRRIRDLYRALKERGRHVLFVSPRLAIPEDAKKEIYVVEYELPDDAEISKILEAHLRRRLGIDIDEPAMRRLALAMRGLTADEIGHVVSKVFAARKTFDEAAFLEILAEKEQMSRKEGVLEFVPPRFSLDDIGGYAVLKDMAAEAAGALLAGRARRRHPDPEGHPADGDLRLREEPLRQDDLHALEPAALPPRHERGLRDGQRGDDVPAGVARRRSRLARRSLDRRDRDGRRRVPGRPGRLDVAHLLGIPDVDAGEGRARLRGGDGQPHPPAARGDHPQGPFRPGLLRRPAERGRAQADLRAST